VGTVTLLLADVEGSTRLWETRPEDMTAAVAGLDAVVQGTVGRHGGVRPVEQGEGDSFVAAFARASDAVACAADLQRADLAPIRLRIGIHTGEVQLRDEGNYIGSAVNRCARVRDLGHGGQSLLSAATRDLVEDRLPAGAWLADMGVHRLRDLARPEHVFQLCHPELDEHFPGLRSLDAFPHNLPIELTSFVGRQSEVAEISGLLRDTRLVTLTGTGGAGKTRLALHVGAELLAEFPDGVWLAELAPIAEPELVPSVVLRVLGLHEEPARPVTETLVRHLADKDTLLLLDNCEHLTDACASLADSLLRACPELAVLATSRELLGIPGELSWRVPPMSLPSERDEHLVDALDASDAMQLFRERARRTRPDFEITDANLAPVREICRRLDGIPLAIELAASRIRVLSPEQIANGLEDRFRLLTGGPRTSVARQQTLRASVDWSYELLTEPERVLLRRLAVCSGPFDLPAAEAVGAGPGLEVHQVLDQLALLVDKSLVVADDAGAEARYRLLETVRQYALERLQDSNEEDAVRRRHRDHYVAFATRAALEAQSPDHDLWDDRLEAELENLRSAFRWSLAVVEPEPAMQLAVSLYDLWFERGYVQEGSSWLDAALEASPDVDDRVRAEGLAAAAIVGGLMTDARAHVRATEAVELARASGDKRLLARALNAAATAVTFFGALGAPLSEEAVELSRETGDDFFMARPLGGLGFSLLSSGRLEARAVAEEGLAVARRTGNAWAARFNATILGTAMTAQGELAAGQALLGDVAAQASAVGDRVVHFGSKAFEGLSMALRGEYGGARRACEESIAVSEDMGLPILGALGRGCLGIAALAQGDVQAALTSLTQSVELIGGLPGIADLFRPFLSEALLASGDIDGAQRVAEEATALAARADEPYFLGWAHLAAARVAFAVSDAREAEDRAHEGMGVDLEQGNVPAVIDTLELLACAAGAQESGDEATRLLGAAARLRSDTGYRRFEVHDHAVGSLESALRCSSGDDRFDAAWQQGRALSMEEAVAYARRGRGERKRPSLGWASLTPAELDVARLVVEGLANKEIAQRLFVSPRTVQTHLTHIYAKLDLASRVQLARESQRHLSADSR
jgi:predicted ATPase/class 3 adenylate cyclase/DNA-binding CsgD family transcriptional regulator